ncbi:MAG: helix-turn-helix domain-containing protein [Defluviitaleaceae bacterium]|nr:helix-turn-helix domain-containing protein [Defluviitaleaceae bacterium]
MEQEKTCIKIRVAKTVGQNIRTVRKAKSLTTEELAFLSGFNATFIHLIEQGKSGVCASALIKISSAMGIPAEYLFAQPLPPSEFINKIQKNRPPPDVLILSNQIKLHSEDEIRYVALILYKIQTKQKYKAEM